MCFLMKGVIPVLLFKYYLPGFQWSDGMCCLRISVVSFVTLGLMVEAYI